MIELERADELVAEFLAATDGMWERIEVAGSVRRRLPKVNDIDFVGIPTFGEAWQPVTQRDLFDDEEGSVVIRTYSFGEWVTANADEEAPEGVPQTVKRNCRLRGQTVSHTRSIVRFFWQSAEFDVYIAQPDAFAILWLIRTGPNRPRGGYGPDDPGAEQNQALAMRAIRQGKSLAYTQGIGIKKTGEMLTFETEAGVYAELGLPYCPAQHRDHPAWIGLIRSDRKEGIGKVWLPFGDRGSLV